MTPRSLSQILDDLQTTLKGERISINEILEGFHERGLGFFLFLFALPAALPLPAVGVGTVLGLPLLLIALHIVIGRHALWIPQSIRQKGFERGQFQSVLTGARPWIQRLEILIAPRLGFMTQGIASRLTGLAACIMCFSVLLPVPLTNTVPSMGLALIGLGLLMRDGLAVIAGLLVGLIWIGILIWAVMVLGPEGLDFIKHTIKSMI